MKDKSFALTSTLAAFLASLCCLGPLVLGGAGLGAALVSTFAPLRPYFLGLSVFLLAGGFYYVYRKPQAAQVCADGTCAPESPVRRLAKPLLWLATLAVAALALFPYYGVKLVRGRRTTPVAAAAALETAQLKVAGMDCEVCAGVIQKKLIETRGVAQAEVRYPAGTATVTYDPAQVRPDGLIAAVSAAGYKASLPSESQAASGTPAAGTAGLQVTQCALKVSGMTCSGCAAAVKQALLKLNGVKAANVDSATGAAQIEFDPNKTAPEKIVAAFNQASSGFRVDLAGPKKK